MSDIIATLASTITTENTILPWGNLEPTKQKIIQPAINPQNHPSCIVYPQTQEELSAVMAAAHQNKWSVLPCGNTSKINWGGISKNIDIILSTERLNKLIEHAIGDLTITVEAGIKFSDIQEILRQNRQTLGIDPAFPEIATIGGIVSTANTGSLRQRYGSVRDQILGITFVRTDGSIAKAGGRVVKNVAGYDLMKLFTGAYGTLGIISQVTFRVYPLQETSATVILTGNTESISQAATILQTSELTPIKADLLSNQLVSNLSLGHGTGLMVQFQSIDASVKEQSRRMIDIGNKLGLASATYTDKNEVNLWQQLPEKIHSLVNNSRITCKIGVLPTAAIKIVNHIELGLIHLSSGLGLVQLENSSQILALRQLCESNSGFLTVLSAPIEIKSKLDIWGYNGNSLQLMRGIKKQFDPHNILSPGRFVSGI